MKKNKKIAIIGHFGGNENILDGQTIKTKILYDELKAASSFEIQKVDTYYKRRNPIKLIKDTLSCIFTTKDIIVLLSGNGMRFYFPILFFSKKVLKSRIYHDVIGGNLDQYVCEYPKFKKYLNSFEVNLVETKSMKDKLVLQGINNCEVMPNFKRLKIASIKPEEIKEPYRFCMFSRVMKEKGVEDAVKAVEQINAKNRKNICELDIFGRIDDGYRDSFSELISKSSSAISYKGMVPYDESVDTIKDYFALLFPTYWSGEGFPGTIVDAFSAGIPVIATDWSCNGEIIDNFKNGIIYPNDKVGNLVSAMEWLMKDADNIFHYKMNCVNVAEKYQPEKHIARIIELIEHYN